MGLLFRFRLCVHVLIGLSVAGSTNPAAAAETFSWSAEVRDADTNRPLACRVYVQDAASRWRFVDSRQPDGSAVRYDKQRGAESVERHTCVSAGRFGAELERGLYRVTIERGKEYLPSSFDVRIAGGPVHSTVNLKRWISMADRGWYSGDTHVHRKLDELPTVIQAEDLNVALPLTQWVTTSHTPPGGGKSVPLEGPPQLIQVTPQHVIWPLNTEYEIFSVKGRRHTLGAVFVLNHQRPLTLGAPPVAPIAEEARRQHALLDLDKHSWPWSLMIVPVMEVDLFELTNNHVWRTEFAFHDWTLSTKPDYVEIETQAAGFTERGWIDFGLETYYALLNCGFRLRPTAGTASGVHPVPLGYGRVYVHLGPEFGFQQWMDGLDAGRSFVTTGPMLECTFDQLMPGATVKRSAPGTVRITGTAASIHRLSAIEILVNGRVVKRISSPENRAQRDGGYVSDLDTTVPIETTSWVAVRCWEAHRPGRQRFAHTAPAWFELPDRPLQPTRGQVEYLIKRMDEEIERNRDVLSGSEIDEYRTARRLFEERLPSAVDDAR